MSKNRHKLTIIEPSEVVREGLRVLLETEGVFEVVSQFSDYQSYQESGKRNHCDIILLNPAIINFHKQFAVRDLFADCSDCYLVAIVYSYVDSLTLNSFDGVLDIYDDGDLMTKKLIKTIESGKHSEESGTDSVDLSDREKEILTAVAKGMTNKEIADKYNISTHTVVSHRKNITRKTGVKTVSGLTLYSVFNNLLSEDDLI